jgi:hypothetical protein
MYAHKLSPPQSALIKYRGNTGQIDVKDTVLTILSKNPGMYGAQVAKLIYDQKLFSRSFGYVYEVLGLLQREGAVIRNGRYYYLTGDAVSHDMAVTADIVDTLGKSGVSLEQARFLSSGIIMAGENAIAESKGQNFNRDETVAAGVASAPVKPEMPEDIVDEIELPENLEIEDPFASMGDAERESLKDEADELIAQSYIDEEAAAVVLEEDRKDKLKLKAMSEIRNASDMLEKKVEVNPGKFNGQVIGSVIDVRPSGMTFLITHSDDKSIEFGTVMPLEYADGLTYKLVYDFDEE